MNFVSHFDFLGHYGHFKPAIAPRMTIGYYETQRGRHENTIHAKDEDRWQDVTLGWFDRLRIDGGEYDPNQNFGLTGRSIVFLYIDS